MQRRRIVLIIIFTVIVIALAVAASQLLRGRLRARNADWTPVMQEFDGVPMVQVPAGCFMMGSDAGGDDERPVHEQCFNAAFYIDQTEVTQAQFARFGGTQDRAGSAFKADNRPVEQVDWYSARDFCLLRGGRLPTEAEWEYAARGPDDLVYPWGNDWNSNNAIWEENANQQTAVVGSLPAGVSWVGALDMAGNVWEWTRSLYAPYPHDAADELGNNAPAENLYPVARGGAWNAGDPVILTTTNRRRDDAGIGIDSIGFRCVRSA